MPPSVTVSSRATAHTFHSLTTHGSKLLHVSTLSKSNDPGGFYTNPNIKGGKWLCKLWLTVCLLWLNCQSGRQLPVTIPLCVIIMMMIIQEAKWVRRSTVTELLSIQISKHRSGIWSSYPKSLKQLPEAEYFRRKRMSLSLIFAWSLPSIAEKMSHLKQLEMTTSKTPINDYID